MEDIEKLKLSKRSYNCLKKNNINTIMQLLEINEEELMKIRNLGSKSLDEIKNVIEKIKNGELSLDALIESSKMIDVDTDLNILDIIADKSKRISQILYCDENGCYVDDAKIDNINLSIRSINALKNNGYKYMSQVLKLKISSLNKIKNLGTKSKNEIIDKLKSIVNIEYEVSNNFEVKCFEKISKSFMDDYDNIGVDYNKGLLILNLNAVINENSAIIDTGINENIEETVYRKDFIEKIYRNNFMKNLLVNSIFKFLKNRNDLAEFNEIINYLPSHIKNSDLLKNIINQLVDDERIEEVDYSYRIWYPRLIDYINSFSDDRKKQILFNRLCGNTLEETGNELGVTRERVRQLEAKIIKNMPIVREDYYKEVFEKYEWNEELFKESYLESDLTYGYLKSKYKIGTRNPEYILEDNEIPIEVRERVEKVLSRDYIIVGSSRIKRDRNEILDYILRTYCKDDVLSSDVSDLYYMFLEDYELEKDMEFKYHNRYFETTLANSKKVLWKYGKKLRYYDFSEIDSQKIADALNFSQFEDVEYSTLKLFNIYSDVMQEWDIRDEYELHNLIKKSFDDNNRFNLKVARMPNLEFGKPDRDMQAFDLLLGKAPIENYKLAEEYEKEYGVKANTVLANYFKCIDEFYHDGVYSIDSEALLYREFDKMKEKLVDDIYSIKDVKEIYNNLFPNGNVKLINPYNLKRLGFKVKAQLIYSDKYANLEKYLTTVILKNDIFDSNSLNSRITKCNNYYKAVQMLSEQFEIVEFLPSQFINISRLKENGIDKEELQNYVNDVYKFVQDELFTIKSLRKKGFENKLDDLGFDDWFYSSLLRCDSRFKYRRVDKTVLFRKGNTVVKLKDLIEDIVYECKSMDIYDLMEKVKKEYGINIEKWDMSYMAKEKGLYYDAVMEKIYIDYDEYFQEV